MCRSFIWYINLSEVQHQMSAACLAILCPEMNNIICEPQLWPIYS